MRIRALRTRFELVSEGGLGHRYVAPMRMAGVHVVDGTALKRLASRDAPSPSLSCAARSPGARQAVHAHVIKRPDLPMTARFGTSDHVGDSAHLRRRMRSDMRKASRYLRREERRPMSAAAGLVGQERCDAVG